MLRIGHRKTVIYVTNGVPYTRILVWQRGPVAYPACVLASAVFSQPVACVRACVCTAESAQCFPRVLPVGICVRECGRGSCVYYV